MPQNVTHNRKIITEWRKPLGDKDKPYAYRWRLDFYWFSFRIHKWICSDDDRAYHSHPVNMFIIILWGGYIDHYLDASIIKSNMRKTRVYSAPSTRCIFREDRHWVEITSAPTWTFIFTWGQPQKWAFWLKKDLRRKNRDKYFFEHGNHICD